MYTLRTLDDSTTGSVLNQALGQSYTAVNRFEHPERFRELFKTVFSKDHVVDLGTKDNNDAHQTIGFIISEDDNIIPINKGLANYIMTDTGRTFERVNKVMGRSAKVN